MFTYLSLIIYIAACFVLVFLLMLVAFLLAPLSYDKNKETAYECGFHPFDDSRKEFNVHFYIIALLFIVFDLEIVFLLPWILNYHTVNEVSFWTIMYFLFILLAGFVYEWKKGVLDW